MPERPRNGLAGHALAPGFKHSFILYNANGQRFAFSGSNILITTIRDWMAMLLSAKPFA